jgi:purine-cytosine permease-like protein
MGAALGVSLDVVFVRLGIGVVGLISVVGIGWTTNDNNAYTAGLALSTAIYPIKKINRVTATIIVSFLGVAGALLGIGNLSFITWISSFHGSFNMSLVGVMVAHYLFVSRDKFLQTKGVAGFFAWLISGLLVYFDLVPIKALAGAVIAFVLYLTIYYGIEKKLFGENEVSRLEPFEFRK